DHDAGAAQVAQDRLEELAWQRLAARQRVHRDRNAWRRCRMCLLGQHEQCPDGVVGPGRDVHRVDCGSSPTRSGQAPTTTPRRRRMPRSTLPKTASTAMPMTKITIIRAIMYDVSPK